MRIMYELLIDKKLYTGQFVHEQKKESSCDRVTAVYTETIAEPGKTGNIAVELTDRHDKNVDAHEYSIKVRNESMSDIEISKCNLSISVDSSSCVVNYFTGEWGGEFTPVEAVLRDKISFGTETGRSSRGCEPFASLKLDGMFLNLALAWSGNWEFTAERGNGTVSCSMGIHSKDFYSIVKPGEHFVGATVVAAADTGSSEDASHKIRRYVFKYMSLLNEPGKEFQSLPFIYNHWWPYEDRSINEDVFLENVRLAKDMGMTNALLDAGWFGIDREGSQWYEKRGDWDIENNIGFPRGIAALADDVIEAGVQFGIWCEIEALGVHARLNETHPEMVAKRDGKSLGYVCFGNAKTVEWAHGIVDKLVNEYKASWIKFDFNLDPGSGCDCVEHGHGAGDGLYHHYLGYYTFLEDLHKKYPKLIIENCSSGGLRFDLGIASRTHFSFLSDPDYTEHHLQCFWGAASFMHPSSCFHFTWSDTNGTHNVTENPINENTAKSFLDYVMRAGMMGECGISMRLPKLPEWCRKRIGEHIEFYHSISGKYILDGDMYRLGDQPLRNGGGARFTSFQYIAKNGDVIVFAFRLKGGPESNMITPVSLPESMTYDVTLVDKDENFILSSRELMEKGICLSHLPEEGSEIILLTRR